MLHKIFSIRDEKSKLFGTPFYKVTHGEAERDFKTIVNDEKTKINKYPEDFDLYYMGEYDDNTGKFDALETPQHMTKAVNCLKSGPEIASL